MLCVFICTFLLITLHHGDKNFLFWHLYQIHTFNNNLNEEGITSHLMCANFFMINLNVIITFMLQLFNNNREALAKHVTYTLSQYPGRIQPGKILSELCSVKSLPGEKLLDFLLPWQYCITYFTPGKIPHH